MLVELKFKAGMIPSYYKREVVYFLITNVIKQLAWDAMPDPPAGLPVLYVQNQNLQEKKLILILFKNIYGN